MIKQSGLSKETVDKLRLVFEKYKKVERVILYGSRAMGTAKKGSDIDLTLVGESLSFEELSKISNEIDDLLLPHTVDLSIYHQIDNSSLIDHIKRVGKVFYGKSKEL